MLFAGSVTFELITAINALWRLRLQPKPGGNKPEIPAGLRISGSL
jgi:hypothetical protein